MSNLILSNGAATVLEIAPAKPPDRKSKTNRLVLDDDLFAVGAIPAYGVGVLVILRYFL